MKKISIIIAILAAIASSANAEISTTASNLENSASSISKSCTNINDAVASILMGAKSVGGEIYSSSKDSIASAVEIVKKQAPDLVKEFIIWNLIGDMFPLCGWLFVSLCVFSFFIWTFSCEKKLKKDNRWRDNREPIITVRFISLIVSIAVFTISSISYGTELFQIYFAPKFFILQYVIQHIRG